MGAIETKCLSLSKSLPGQVWLQSKIRTVLFVAYSNYAKIIVFPLFKRSINEYLAQNCYC